ncbi:hypothetical protein [Bacillus halotolerans]
MKRLKALFILMSILIVTCSCDLQPTGNKTERNNNKTGLKNISKGDFIVGFSHTLDRGSELAIYKDDGSVEDSIMLKDGINLSTSSYNKNDTFFSSNRSNNHFMINNKTGCIKKFNDKSLSKATEDEGAFFINTSENYVLHDINVGYTDSGLQGELIYWKDDKQKKNQIKLDGEIVSAQVLDNKIYAITSDEENMSIISINPKTNKQEKKASIPNKTVYFTDDKDAFQIFDERTFMLAINDNVNEKEASKILLIDKETLKTKKEVVMENGFIPTKLKRINDEIVAVSYNGKVSFFDENLNKKKSFKFYAGNKEMLLNDIKFGDSNMYVLIKGFDMQKENVLGEITSYDLKSGKKVNTTPLKAKKEWEIARFELLHNE